MEYPSHYLAIKPIFDLCLFGIENSEEHFATSQNLKFKEEFLAYHEEFLSKEDYCDHELLLQTCYRYLSNIPLCRREDIVKRKVVHFIQTNEHVYDNLNHVITFD